MDIGGRLVIEHDDRHGFVAVHTESIEPVLVVEQGSPTLDEQSPLLVLPDDKLFRRRRTTVFACYLRVYHGHVVKRLAQTHSSSIHP